MKRIRAVVGLALVAALALPPLVHAQQPGFKVIVNNDNPAKGLPRAKVALMFMKATAKWGDGAAVEPVDQLPGSPVRAEFSAAIHNRDVDAVKTAWQRAVFSGRGEPPPEKASDEEVIAFVASRPGGIGYVSQSAPTDKVKTLDILK